MPNLAPNLKLSAEFSAQSDAEFGTESGAEFGTESGTEFGTHFDVDFSTHFVAKLDAEIDTEFLSRCQIRS